MNGKFISGIILLLLGFNAAAETGRPNVLLIMSDNQSPSLLGTYGNPVIRTPHIDQLAAEGMLFEHAYATTGVCSPSRAVLMTGLIPSANGVHNGLPAKFAVERYAAIEEVRNLPQTLADAGYSTALVGKYHLGVSEVPTLGFDYWVTFRGGHTVSYTDAEIYDNGETYNVRESGEHLTDFWTRRAIEYLQQRQDAEQPFFLWLSYNGPYILPPTVNEPPVSRFAALYKDNPPPMPQEPIHPFARAWFEKGWGTVPEDGILYNWAALEALNNRNAMLNVAAETTHVDDGVGKVMATLRTLGILDNTLVIYLSDQGSSYGQNGIWGNSSWAIPGTAYDSNMQVPLILRHPEHIAAGVRATQMIDQFDVFPTLLDYLGLGALEIARSPGQSFAPILRGAEQDWNDEVYFEYIQTRAIRTARWKLIKRFLIEPNELFDLQNDPEERHNLYDSPAHAEIQAQLDEKLTAFFATYADPEFDVWHGGTGKALLYYEDDRSAALRERFADFREPFVEKRTPFRDAPR